MATAQSIAGVAHAKVLEASKAIADAEKEVTVKAEAENIAAGAPKALQVSHGVGRRHAPNIVASERRRGGVRIAQKRKVCEEFRALTRAR